MASLPPELWLQVSAVATRTRTADLLYDHGIMLQLRGYWGRRAPARAGAIFGQEYLPVAIETDSLGPNISTLFKRVCRNREGELFDKVLELLYGYRDGRRCTRSADRVWRARLVMSIVTARERRPSTSVSVVYRCAKNMGTGFSSLADRGHLSTLSCIIMCIIEHKPNQTKPNQNPRSQLSVNIHYPPARSQPCCHANSFIAEG